MGEEVLRQNLDGAFAPPSGFPDPRLLSRTMAAISSGVALPEPVGRPAHYRLSPAALQWAAAVMVIVIAGTATVAAFLALHRAPAPGKAITAPVIFPTKMVSSRTGWAVTSHGSSQQAWRTSDGGLSWTEVTPKSAIDHNVSAYTNYFLDESHAWITEMAGGSASTAPYLVTFRTADGGQTWQRGTPLNAKFQSMPSEDFLDANSGWLVITSFDMTHATWPNVYATTDGGLHWSLEASQAGADVGSGSLVPGGAEPSFISPTVGWLTVGLYADKGNGSFFFSRTAVLATHDGGRTWRTQSLPVQPAKGAVVDAPAFFGQKQGVMVLHAIDPNSAVKAVLFATSDGGATWTAQPLDWAYIWSIEFVDRNHGWAVAGPGSDFTKSSGGQTIPLPLYRTDDGGVTWKAVATSLDLQQGRDRVTDIHFVDQSTGFATVWNDSGPTEVLRSDDGGRNWSVVARCTTGLGLSYPPPPCPEPK